ncbi:MAG: hypothetical protein KKD31_04355 [Bacteroidetes bacterium]|nr:hypothetical protein [Bacteroidota bacterium]
MKISVIVRMIALIASVLPVSSIRCQTYNYLPFHYFDAETNPAMVASVNMNNRFEAFQSNNFSQSDGFSYSGVQYSKYFSSIFSGIGLGVNYSDMGKSGNYLNTVLSFGYRNVILDEVYIRLGASYKLQSIHATPGFLDYHTVIENEPDKKYALQNNMNFSLALSSQKNEYYVSFSYLNSMFPWNTSEYDFSFPKYYLICIGDFMNLFDKKRAELNLISFIKTSATSGKSTISEYISFSKDLRRHRRRRGHKMEARIGGSIGFLENENIHFAPYFGLFNKKCFLRLGYSFHVDKVNFQSVYSSTSQLGLIYLL